MRMLLRTFAVCGLLLAALPCLAAAPGTPFDEDGFNPRMLDASVPQAERLKLFGHVIALANQGQVRAQDLAGTMYWQGAKIAGSPVKSNLDQARKLLANAATHGDVLAMAKMGELQLKTGNVKKAMIWAQLYGHYLHPTRKAREYHGRDYAYAMDLIHRIDAAGGGVDAGIQKNVSNVMGAYDASIRAGIKARRQHMRSGDPRLIQYPKGTTPQDMMNTNGVAEFVLAFNPDGSFKQAWLLASWPTDAMATLMRPWLNRARANPVGAGAGTRYLNVPLRHNSHKFHRARPAHVN